MVEKYSHFVILREDTYRLLLDALYLHVNFRIKLSVYTHKILHHQENSRLGSSKNNCQNHLYWNSGIQ